MKRKIESWLYRDFPDLREFATEYAKKPPREMVVMSCAMLDTMLADLLLQRFRGDEKEAGDFVGLDGDGRAPCGAFGAKIQAAYLVGLIDRHDLKALRAIKNIRNLFSHRVEVDFDSPQVRILIKEILSSLDDSFETLGRSKFDESKKGADLPDGPNASDVDAASSSQLAGFYSGSFALYHHYLRALAKKVRHVTIYDLKKTKG